MKTINVSDETYGKIKDQLLVGEKEEINTMDDFVGKKVFIRTVTYHLVGRVVKIVGKLVFLDDASWIAASGRFMQAIKNGTLDEVEPVGEWFFNVDCMVDGGIWRHELPKEQK